MTDQHEGNFIKKAQDKERYLQQHKKGVQRRKLRAASKKLKSNHRAPRTRRKDWLPDTLEDWDDLDYETEERILPPGEGERRRAREKAAFDSPEPKTENLGTALFPSSVGGHEGRVVEVSQGLCRVALEDRTLLCSVRGSLSAEHLGFTNVVAVGDRVLVNQENVDQGVIETVLPRSRVLARPDVFHSHLQQVIAANVDQLLIVSSWQAPPLWPELIDRYLVVAQRDDLPVLICVNKMDLVEVEADCEAALQPYRTLGYPLILTSTITGQGVDELRRWLLGQTTVLAGLSGVGKSSLLAAAQPGLQLRTGAVSQSSGQGQHTTTQATLIQLNAESAVVDTPGIREFGLSGLLPADLAHYFPEMASLAATCRFSDCAHLNEPDCAVQTAVESGAIAASRYHSYRQIYESLLQQ